ncbi:unnamed protein product [Chrysodeixis includens]|uniref:Uncharacterized protein n=1 Tax=Chrysodeixis includens TaxID=689277 RepID=A0A9N8PZN4_CHRIL|nr:unnamed protein product [Chrysodeixis includens]
MELLKIVRALVLIAPACTMQLQIKRNDIGAEVCDRLTQEPFFDTEMVVGKPWRIYFAWNMKLESKCLDMSFKNATPMIINRIWNDMYEYLETQPYWDAATLLVSMGKAHHEMLLFADQGAAGRFTGVPNVIRDGNITPSRKAVPLLKFHMKLLHEGRYLLMSDCQIGVTTLSARTEPTPYRADISGIVSYLNFGDGFHACTSDRNRNELLGMQ